MWGRITTECPECSEEASDIYRVGDCKYIVCTHCGLVIYAEETYIVRNALHLDRLKGLTPDNITLNDFETVSEGTSGSIFIGQEC